MDRGAWRATVHRVTERQTRLSEVEPLLWFLFPSTSLPVLELDMDRIIQYTHKKGRKRESFLIFCGLNLGECSMENVRL